MQRLLSLAAGVAPELHAHPVELTEAAASAGWPATGVWFDPASWTADTTRTVRRCLDDNGLVALDVEVVRMGQSDDYGAAIVDVAAALGARNILTVSTFDDPGATAARFATLCARAAPADITVCIEFMRFTSVRTLDDALDVVRRAAQPNGAILLDALHVSRSGTTYEQIHACDQALFPYAQWCDGPAEPRGWDDAALITDALDDRCVPGEGALGADQLVRTLAPTVPLSLEVRSKALRTDFPDVTDRAAYLLRRTTAALRGAES